MYPEIFVYGGFLVAAYAIVANDSIQTLGTFLASNAKRPWWVLWIFACIVLISVLGYGWLYHDGDVSYGRLTKFPEPDGGVSWIHVIPPIVLLILTRFGVPVSTTFLVLTVFAPTNLGQMLIKSLLGYAVAFAVGIAIYWFITGLIEKRFQANPEGANSLPWMIFQWCSTAFLWSQWLIQDLANIFVYLPRQLSFELLAGAVLLMCTLHGIMFYLRGGRIQRIVTTKTTTDDIRSASLVDLMYGIILFVFKEMSNMPMSTTWVFLGLLAGRELAMVLRMRHRGMGETVNMILWDAGRATFGLAVSVALAFGLPILASW